MLIDALTVEFNVLLDTSVASINQRWKPFSEFTQLVLFGAGQLGAFVAQSLGNDHGLISAFADDTPSLQGQQLHGINVLSLDAAITQFADSAIFVVCIMSEHHRYTETYRRLSRLGVTQVISFQQLAYCYPERLLPWYQFDSPCNVLAHKQQWQTTFSLLADDLSRQHLIRLLDNRMNAELDNLPIVEQAYFPSDLFDINGIKHYVDCGAFDGDTLDVFIKLNPGFSSVVAFEPDPDNYQQLMNRVQAYDAAIKDKIECKNQAVSDHAGSARFHSTAGAASLLDDSGDVEVSVVDLDSALSGVEVDFVKFDIEGAELAALNGAKFIIAQQMPILAISSYHLPNDIWKIPQWLISRFSGYQIAFRLEGTDGLGGVVYAIPERYSLS